MIHLSLLSSTSKSIPSSSSPVITNRGSARAYTLLLVFLICYSLIQVSTPFHLASGGVGLASGNTSTNNSHRSISSSSSSGINNNNKRHNKFYGIAFQRHRRSQVEAIPSLSSSSSSGSSSVSNTGSASSTADPNSSMKQIRTRMNDIVRQMKSQSSDDNDNDDNNTVKAVENDNNNNNSNTDIGKLEELKLRESELSLLLEQVRKEKLSVIKNRPLTIGIIGYGRFGQFIASTFVKYGNVIVTSRSDYTSIANEMGCTYVPMDNLNQFVSYDLDVIVVATSIVSFEETIQMLSPYLQKYIDNNNNQSTVVINGDDTKAESSTTKPKRRGPLIVDVLSVKEHARQIMIQYLPVECDILCTHPMFGPDSGKNGWYNLNFVYEKTRINQIVLQKEDQQQSLSSSFGSKRSRQQQSKKQPFGTKSPAFVNTDDDTTQIQKRRKLQPNDTLIDSTVVQSVYDDILYIEGMDRIERFLSIWEEEGCNMVCMLCSDHDMYAANSQFITHLVGRVLASQGLESTPIDTNGFQSILKLISNTCSDSFDLFYGLYKYNRKNSYETIQQLQVAMNDVVTTLQLQETKQQQQNQQQQFPSKGIDNVQDNENTATNNNNTTSTIITSSLSSTDHQ